MFIEHNRVSIVSFIASQHHNISQSSNTHANKTPFKHHTSGFFFIQAGKVEKKKDKFF